MIVALYPALQPYANTNWIHRIDTHVKQVMKDVGAIGASDVQIAVESDKNTSFLHNLATYRPSYEANQWAYIRGQALGYNFQVTLPFRYGVRQPYQVVIVLKSKTNLKAALWPGIFSSRGKWYTEPLDRSKGKALRALRLPSVGWTHHASTVKFHLKYGGYVLPPDADCETNRWIICSAYQGMVFVRPKVAKYLRNAGRLDTYLQAISLL